jgi:DNA-binding response OmpR family regulator
MERKRILIVDSEPDFVAKARKTLEGSYQVSVASSREEGLEKAKREYPDLVIVGFLEPRGSSFKLHKELRENLTTREIPLLVVDVRPEEHSRKGWTRDEGMQMDAEGYLTRPIESDELREEVARVLKSVTAKPVELEEVLEQMEMLLKRVEKIEKMLVA